MVSPEDIRRRIEEAFPGALVTVADSTGAGDHFEVRVRAAEFAGRPLVEQHRLVYGALGPAHGSHPRTGAPDGVAAGGQGMNDVIAEIEQEIRENKVVLYMKGTPAFPMCGFSAAAVKVLKEVGVPFKAVDVLAEPEKREAIKQYSSWPTIPQLYVGGKFVGGSDILREMHARGEFAALVRQAAGAS
jgi:monothiol glutaredoxin